MFVESLTLTHFEYGVEYRCGISKSGVPGLGNGHGHGVKWNWGNGEARGSIGTVQWESGTGTMVLLQWYTVVPSEPLSAVSICISIRLGIEVLSY